MSIGKIISAGMVSSLKISQLWEENIFFLLTPKLKVLLFTNMLPLDRSWKQRGLDSVSAFKSTSISVFFYITISYIVITLNVTTQKNPEDIL